MSLLNIHFLVSIGGWEVLLIFLVVLLLFGAKKLPELAKGLGKKTIDNSRTDPSQHPLQGFFSSETFSQM